MKILHMLILACVFGFVISVFSISIILRGYADMYLQDNTQDNQIISSLIQY